MTNKPTLPKLPSGDTDICVMLDAALAAPPVPPSLTKRLDAGLESRWGSSPGLVRRRLPEPSAVFGRGMKTLRGWPIATGIAATLVIAFVLVNGSKTYAWTSMLDALARQPMLRMTSRSGDHELVASALASQPESEQTLTLVRFLLRAAGDRRDPSSLTSLRIVDQAWSRSDDSVSMQVRFATSTNQRIEMDLVLDPDTSLPRSVSIHDTDFSRNLPMTASLSYPARTMAVQPFGSHKLETPRSDLPHDVTDELVSEATSLDNGISGAATNWQSVAVTHRSEMDVLNRVNETLEGVWKAESIHPVGPAADQAMLRRVYLDLVGRTPTVTEARDYINDSGGDRYRRLVDRLLSSPDHASHLATTWRTFLIPEGVDLSAVGGREAFDRWLADQFAGGTSYDEIVRKLLLAEGRLANSGPLLFYSAAKLDPDRLAARTSRVFLGIRLECAQCHDHPFEPWKQEDFWSYAAFFAQISRPKGELESVSKVMQVRDVDHGEVMLPETDQVVAPRLLGQAASKQPESDRGDDPASQVRRQRLARWLTSPTNPYFARASVNRVWAQMFGRGIVDPVDDFGTMNQPLAPELLDVLASQLIDTGFNLRSTFRTIALSDAYRLSSGANDADETRIQYFAQMGVKTLTAAQLYDCISVATRLESGLARNPMGSSIARFGNSDRDLFLQQFASPAGNRIEYLSGIPQALTLMNGGLVGSATGPVGGGLLKSLEAPFFSNDERIEILFLATLSRLPSKSERTNMSVFIADDTRGEMLRENLSDLLWALLNSAEFTLNH